MDCVSTDRHHALDEENGSEPPAVDLVREVPGVFPNADRGKPIGKVRVAELSPR